MSEVQSETQVVRVIGHQWAPQVHMVKDVLSRHRVPYEWLDLDRDPAARALLESVTPGERRVPVVLLADGTVLTRPSERELAEHIGLDTQPDLRFYDLVIVGGGPAGLAAAVYGASEGLRTVVVEREIPGGQAGTSANIENYLGFPEGLSGADLARRGIDQAERFGAEILSTRCVTGIGATGRYRYVTLDDGSEIGCHTVLLATGVRYRWLDAPGCPDLIGAGVYYGAAAAEAEAFEGLDVFVLGGGNSAGQAACHLAEFARRVIMIVLESSLEESMSAYLVERITETESIEVRTRTTVVGAEGERRLERLVLRNEDTTETETVEASGLYVFIGGRPSSEWLNGAVLTDESGFVYTGRRLRRKGADWPLERDPLFLETSIPGVFAAGDVRSGSVKRLGSAVGEGAVAIQLVHEYIAGL